MPKPSQITRPALSALVCLASLASACSSQNPSEKLGAAPAKLPANATVTSPQPKDLSPTATKVRALKEGYQLAWAAPPSDAQHTHAKSTAHTRHALVKPSKVKTFANETSQLWFGHKVAGVVAKFDPKDDIQPWDPKKGGWRSLAKKADVLLSHFAEEGSYLRDHKTGMEVHVALKGAKHEHDHEALGYALYDKPLGEGSSWLHRITPEGEEDYLELSAKLENQLGHHISYRVDLGKGVAGVRNIGTVVEFLDKGGVPRLRMNAPMGVSGNARVPLKVNVRGCAVDHSPAPPFGRAVTPPGATICTIDVSWEAVKGSILVDPAWVTTGSMAVARQQPIVLPLAGAKFLIALGALTSTAELFDEGAGTFAATGPFCFHPQNLLGVGASLTAGTEALLYGNGLPGPHISQKDAKMCKYSLSNGTFSTDWSWTYSNSDAAQYTFERAFTLAGDQVAFTQWRGVIRVYDPGTKAFGTSVGLPSAGNHCQGAICKLDGNRLAFVGGRCTNQPYSSQVTIYDHMLGTFSKLGNLQLGRHRANAIAWDASSILVASGSGAGTSTTTELIDLTNGASSSGPNLLADRTGHEMGKLSDGGALFMGGQGTPAELIAGSPLASTHAGTPPAIAWTAFRAGSSSTAFAFGGYAGGQAQALVWRWSRQADGGGCESAAECTSGQCVDGVCCDTNCNGPCQACTASKKGQGSNGTCGPIVDGDDPDDECAQDGSGVCQLPGACDGAGACKSKEGLACGPSSCASSSVMLASAVCDSAGECQVKSGNIPCNEYICENGACRNNCTINDHCAAGHECSEGECVKPKAAGETCKSAVECESNFCVDGVCCNSACSGECESCDGSVTGGMNGACTPIAKGTDPDSECEASGGVCGASGYCNGARACEKYAPAETSCGLDSCDGDKVMKKICDGAGTCATEPKDPCGNYVCDPFTKACKNTCASDADCTAGNQCNTSTGQCGGSSSSCKDATTAVSVTGSETSCAPFVCENGACLENCSAKSDCVAEADCLNGQCVAQGGGAAGASSGAATPPTGDSGGCSVGAPGDGGSNVGLWLLGLGLAGVFAARRREELPSEA